jgi:hypothetical protein
MVFPKKLKRLIKIGMFLGGLVILFYIIIHSGIVYNLFFTASIPLLILAFLLSNLNIIVKIYRWKYLSEHYHSPITMREASIVTVSSLYFANITPGKVGDLFKAYYMHQKHLLSFFDGVSMIFYERFFELMILFLTATAIIFISLRGSSLIILELCATIIILLVVFYYFAPYFMNVLEQILKRVPLVKTDSVDFHIKKLPFFNILAVFIVTSVSLILEFLRLWVVAMAFGCFLNPIHVSIVFSLAIIAGLISQIPLGIGITEGSMNFLLQEIGALPSVSMSIVLTDRAMSMYYSLLIGFIFSKFSLDTLTEANR